MVLQKIPCLLQVNKHACKNLHHELGGTLTKKKKEKKKESRKKRHVFQRFQPSNATVDLKFDQHQLNWYKTTQWIVQLMTCTSEKKSRDLAVCFH